MTTTLDDSPCIELYMSDIETDHNLPVSNPVKTTYALEVFQTHYPGLVADHIGTDRLHFYVPYKFLFDVQKKEYNREISLATMYHAELNYMYSKCVGEYSEANGDYVRARELFDEAHTLLLWATRFRELIAAQHLVEYMKENPDIAADLGGIH